MEAVDFRLSKDDGFALIKRGDEILQISGPTREIDSLSEIPDPDLSGGETQSLAWIPFAQIEKEREFKVNSEAGCPLGLMQVTQAVSHKVDAVLSGIGGGIEAAALTSTISDTDFETLVTRVKTEAIAGGMGCNFLLSRGFSTKIENMSHEKALTLFRNLVMAERGAHWTFMIYDPKKKKYLIGASPERHVSLENGELVMNPISGTARFREFPSDPAEALDYLLNFLRDPKEIGELAMALDEELKQVARICNEGGRVLGPFIKKMSHLLHTEYLLRGITREKIQTILKETLFAATVTGSPIQSACEVIAGIEGVDRGYYAGVAAGVGAKEGSGYLDTSILIRTCEIDADTGEVVFRTGASIVADSDPVSERKEVDAKAQGLLNALRGNVKVPEYPGIEESLQNPLVQRALMERNKDLSSFWLQDQSEQDLSVECLRDKKIVIIDAEDDFTQMLGHIIQCFGATVEIVSYKDYAPEKNPADITILGPGPGDPSDLEDPKMQKLHGFAQGLIDNHQKVLGVCLGHQILCAKMGLELKRRDTPQQGIAKEIDFFGQRRRLGFYNSFSGQKPPEAIEGLEIAADEDGSVNALQKDNVYGVQFHPESVLSRDGVGVLRQVLASLVNPENGSEAWRLD